MTIEWQYYYRVFLMHSDAYRGFRDYSTKKEAIDRVNYLLKKYGGKVRIIKFRKPNVLCWELHKNYYITKPLTYRKTL